MSGTLTGSCVDKVNDFECICAPGFSGRMCNEQINECASNPCKYGGTCTDLVNGYECHCTPDREGNQCQYKLGEAPETTTTTTRSTSTTSSTTSSVSGSNNQAQLSAVKSADEENSSVDVELTQEQLILIVCFGSGIPMVLLFVLVSILLYRRYKKKREMSEEAQQNEINAMNNRIHNNVSSKPTGGMAAKHGQYKEGYPTEKSIDCEATAAAAYQIPLSYRNEASAAHTPSKLTSKDLIKNINAVKERQGNTAAEPAVRQQFYTAQHQLQYGVLPTPSESSDSIYSTPSNYSNTNRHTNSSTSISIISDTSVEPKAAAAVSNSHYMQQHHKPIYTQQQQHPQSKSAIASSAACEHSR